MKHETTEFTGQDTIHLVLNPAKDSPDACYSDNEDCHIARRVKRLPGVEEVNVGVCDLDIYTKTDEYRYDIEDEKGEWPYICNLLKQKTSTILTLTKAHEEELI